MPSCAMSQRLRFGSRADLTRTAPTLGGQPPLHVCNLEHALKELYRQIGPVSLLFSGFWESRRADVDVGAGQQTQAWVQRRISMERVLYAIEATTLNHSRTPHPHQSRRPPSPGQGQAAAHFRARRRPRRPPRTRCPSPRRAAPTRTTRRCRSAAVITSRRRPWPLILCRASAASLRVVKAARRSRRAARPMLRRSDAPPPRCAGR